MIYLLEDKKNRLEENKDKHDFELDGIIIKDGEDISLWKKQDIEKNIDKFFSDAKLILLHYTYNFKNQEGDTASDISSQYVADVFNARNIPVVFFSGGISNANVTMNKEVTNGTINSDEMYANLKWFLSEIKKSPEDESNVAKLVYGKEYLRIMLSRFQINAYYELGEFSNDDILDESATNSLRYDESNLKQIRNIPQLKEAGDLLESMLTKQGQTVVGFLFQVQKIIDEYEKL